MGTAREPNDGEALEPGSIDRTWIGSAGVDPDGLDWRWAARAEIQAAKRHLETAAARHEEQKNDNAKTRIRSWAGKIKRRTQP